MVIENPVAAVNAAGGANGNSNAAHPSGIPQDQIDNIMSGIANTGDVKMNNHRKKLRQRFDIIKKLGQGTYGKVQLGINKETGQEVAIKTIKKCKIEAEADLVRIRREVQIMSSVQHPNIIHIYEVFENREKMVLVMEFAAGGELYDYLSERKVLNEEEARRIFRQVSTAVYYCHKHKICHRDLKLENILLDEHGNAKIADFGLSNVFDDQRLLATFCGSPLYASPEIVEGTPYQGPEVDCWSLGVLLYTLVYGSMPFDGSNFKRLVKQISQGDYYEPKKPSRASTLIRDMLTVCPRKRANIEQICAHWWVNENDNVSCLELAENLANQTPVRLDVLLSLTPAAITADQLVVPSADGVAAGKAGNAAMPRSHSVGSILDMNAANTTTAAERRILDMVAAGGEAALMPSPTRTITPAQSPVQTKRKLETTISMENAAAALKKKEKAGSSSFVIDENTVPLSEDEPMETEGAIIEEPPPTPAAAVQQTPSATFSAKDMEQVGDLCEQLMNKDAMVVAANQVNATTPNDTMTMNATTRQKTVGKLDAVQEAPEEKDATKVIKKFVNNHKTADLVNAIGQVLPSDKINEGIKPTTTTATTTNTSGVTSTTTPTSAPPPFVRKCSLQDESTLAKFNGERRKSRILETAEKFQQMNANQQQQQQQQPPPSLTSIATTATTTPGNDKPKKIVIPGVSVGSFKKEFERKASNATIPPQGPTPGERRALEQAAAAAAEAAEREVSPPACEPPPLMISTATTSTSLEGSDSKNSVSSLTLDDARRSMENSIALLRQAQHETVEDVDQLCAKTESFGVSEPTTKVDRERKLQNARNIIGNAIQPVIRRPQAQPQFPLPQPPSSLLPSSTFYGMAGGGGGVGISGSSVSGNGNGNSNSNNNNYNSGIRSRSFGSHLQRRASIANPHNAHFGGGGYGISYGSGNGNGSGSGSGGSSSSGNDSYFNIDSGIGSIGNVQQFNNVAARDAIAAARQNIMRHFSANFGNCQQQQQQQQQQQLYNQQQFNNSVASKAKLFSQPNPPQQHQQPQHQKRQQLATQFANTASTAAAAIATATASGSASAHAVAGPAASTASAVNNLNCVAKPFYNARTATPTSNWLLKSSPGGTIDPNNSGVKTSTASITLKSATLPRRKTAKTEIQLDIKPRIMEQQPAMRFSTEMQHPVPDLRSAPPRDGPAPFSPIKTMLNTRAASLEPKEHIIHIQRPPQMAYTRTTSNTTNRSGSLSRQSTNDSESDTTTTNMSQSTITTSSQPIKKSPREFIIPIAVEGGGFITPREGSIEPSESSHTAASSRSTFNRFNQRPARRIGSLLSDATIDESGLQFQKMRTGSTNRDVEDDGRFTLHRLRSSRPVKKINQDNDSNSSGEEDDDDGFEILTAENLFSTLLDRVRALTNRINVNNDLTTGFPNSSRLLTSMRHNHGPFWNQEPFTSRLNNTAGNTGNTGNTGIGVGVPWRHSMSRDLGSDMESMFSRTGATLPRGSSSRSSSKNKRPSSAVQQPTTAADATATTPAGDTTDAAGAAEAPLDLADLDLSRLRLSKKELETLSSIAPGLPKCFQEQLLAKLPPTQARKLSRTLSMQNSSQTPTVKVYKRSQSGGRGVLSEMHPNMTVERCDPLPEETETSPVPVVKSKANSTETPNMSNSSSNTSAQSICRRSLSRSRYDLESGIPTPVTAADTLRDTRKSRSNSVCRDDYSKSFCSSYTSDISDKYRYYSPYLSKNSRETTNSSTESGSISPYKRYSSISPRESTVGTMSGRPPSGCLSPPPAACGEAGNTNSLRRRTTQRRISRFLRPEFYEEHANANEETAYQREKKQRERDTQNVLREIREKSREPSRERTLACTEHPSTTLPLRKHSLTGVESELLEPKSQNIRHMRNKSLELYNELDKCVISSRPESPNKKHRRSLSRPRNASQELDTHELADKILQELQLLSAMRTEEEQQILPVPREVSVERTTETSIVGLTANNETIAEEKTVTVKKVKKIKPKDKTTDATNTNLTTTTVVKKVKKIVKKADNLQLPTSEVQPPSLDAVNIETQTEIEASEQSQKESKLKRPKSYPTKDIATKTEMPPKVLSKIKHTTIPETSTVCTDETCPMNVNNMTESTVRESRLIRPKSYPASKLTPPKDLKKIVTRSGAAIPCITESDCVPNTSNGNLVRQINSEEKSQSVTPTGKGSVDTSSSSESRPTIKRIIRITKKSKLTPPTPVTPTTPTTLTPVTPIAEIQPKAWKESSPEKKPSKGLLYTIGLKFEKLRDSAMNKDKKSGSSAMKVDADGQPIETNKKIIILKKKKSTENGQDAATIDKDTIVALTAAAIKTKTEKTANKIIVIEETNAKKSQPPEGDKPTKVEKRSRFDAMLRSLRERSVPRSQHSNSESNYIKRAISVEEMPGTCNKNAMNKVLGLFKRSEKEGSAERRVRSTRSTSNIERQILGSSAASSPIYQNSLEAREAAKAESARIMAHDICDCDASCQGSLSAAALNCPDCIAQTQNEAMKSVTKRRDETKLKSSEKPNCIVANEHAQQSAIGNKDKRKALVLDLIKLDNVAAYAANGPTTTSTIRNSKVAYINGNTGNSMSNGLYSNLPPYPTAPNNTTMNSSSNHSSSQHSMENATNNNSCMTNNNNNNSSSMQTSQTSGYRTSSTHEINRNNLLTPSTENMANYSDCSRSYQDDCASTSTFLSPTDEPELYFDNWSVCSEDNYMLHASPSPTVSRLSRASQLSSPTRGTGGESSDPNESVIDRIKRRSFYSRFNEKTPKRTSSIVGPSAVRDYYREQKAAMRATRSNNKLDEQPITRTKERSKSPDITKEFFKPLKLSPVGTELKPPIYKSPYSDYTSGATTSSLVKPRKSLTDVRTSTTPSYLASKHRYGLSTTGTDNHHDYLGIPPTATSTSTSRYKSTSSTSPYETAHSSGDTHRTSGTSGSYYSTYNPKRRSSYTLNGLLPSGTGASSSAATNIDSYATLGRRSIRAYDHRTMSLLDPTTGINTSYRREARTPVRDYTTASISRSNSRYRTSSSSRSPTNI